MCLSKILLSKSRITFGDYKIITGATEGQILTFHIPVINNRRYGWLGYFFKRNDAIECRARVEFFVGEKLLYRYAEHWIDSPIGITLQADSSHHDIPIVSVDFNTEISLCGTPMTTAYSPIPPYRIPNAEDTLITANIEVTSRKKVIAKSQWSIHIQAHSFTPVSLKRIG